MSISYKRTAACVMMAAGILSLNSAGNAQSAPTPEGMVPPPTIDSNEDGKPDAWDRDGNSVPDAWDLNGDGKPDKFDDDGDGKPDEKMEKKSEPKSER